MGLCLQCNKWIKQPEGKRAKLFCNNTCRSNYWYSKNKKEIEGNPKIKDLTRPTNVIEPHKQSENNYSINTFSKPSKAEIEAIKYKYTEERRECNGAEDYFDWLKRVDADERLNKADKDLIKQTH